MTKHAFVTENPGKLNEMRPFFSARGIELLGLRDLGVPGLDVPETGTSLGENAFLKLEAYGKELARHPHLQGEVIRLYADDTGLEIDALGGEPGLHVRRWKDGVTRMTDDEIIAHALEQMKPFTSPKQRGAQFRTVVATAVFKNGTLGSVEQFSKELRGFVKDTADGERTEGMPFGTLFYVPEWSMTLGDHYRLPPEQKKGRHTHREKTFNAALDAIGM